MKKVFIGMVCIGFLVWFYAFKIHNYFSIELLNDNLGLIQELAVKNQFIFIVVFFVTYVIITAFCLPGAALLLTLAAGAIFGFIVGTIIISFASTIGATCAFWGARYFFRDLIKNNLPKTINTINVGLSKDGALYLFTLRLIPIFPFFLINLVMGLTTLPSKTFYWVSQLGMLAGTMIYVNAGLQLSKIDSLSDILSSNILLSFAALALMPLLGKYCVERITTKNRLC